MNPEKLKIAVAEDNELLAESLQEKLELFSSNVEFIFRAKNGKELISMLDKNRAVDIILMDIEMPVMDGISATKIVTEKFPHIKVIMLTVFDDHEKIFNSIKSGAAGYLLKDEPPVKIYEGIKMINKGGAPMSPVIASKALFLLKSGGLPEPTSEKENFTLTSRETEVLVQLSKGLDYNQAAANLFISPSTVRKHIENIYRKLQVHNKIEAVTKASRHNLI